MKKLILIIISIASIAACYDKPAKSTKTSIRNIKHWTIFLKQANASLIMTLPSAYDTILFWKETRCQCISNKYRFQSKQLPIYFDGCCIDSAVPYNKFQVTIQEPLYSVDSSSSPSNEAIIKTHNEAVTYSYEDPRTVQTQYDTILIHKGKVFSIFSNIIHDIEHMVWRQVLETTIYVKGLPIEIKFEESYARLPLNREVFINDRISIIKSIVTRTGT
jgi:hypothetical protein